MSATSASICTNCGHDVSTAAVSVHELATDISDLISTSHPLPQLQLDQVHESLPGYKSSLARVDQRISRLKDELDILNIERDRLQVIVERHQGALSCVRRMPAEILSEIFLAHIDDNHDDFGTSDVDLKPEGPWPSSQVCSRWRAVSFGFPTIWSHIDIHLDAYGNKHRCFPSLSALQIWLSRSGNVPLKVRCNFGRSYASSPAGKEILETLLSSCERWRSISLIVDSRTVTNAFNAVHGRLPLLRHLHLYDPSATLFTYSELRLSGFQIAPQLSSISLTDIPPTSIMLPWSQITVYTSRYDYQGSHLENIQKAVNLHKCTFEDLRFEADSDTETDSILSHPHLRELHFTFNTIENCLGVLDYLALPALETLSLAVDTHGHDVDYDTCEFLHTESLASFLYRTEPPLKTFRLLDLPTTACPKIHAILAAASTVTDLHVSLYDPYYSIFFDLLAYPIQLDTVYDTINGSVLPRLERLSIGCGSNVASLPNWVGDGIDHFVRMISSRRVRPDVNDETHGGTSGQVSVLKSVHLHVPRELGRMMRSALQEQIDDGLEVVWRSHSLTGS